MEKILHQDTEINISTLTADLNSYNDTEKVFFGFLCVLSGRKSFINNVYRDKEYTKIPDVPSMETVVFDSSKVRIVSKDGPVNTWKGVYLVRYIGFEKSQKPGSSRKIRCVDYRFPIEVLKGFNREECSLMYVSGNTLKVRYKHHGNPQPAVQNQGLLTKAIHELENILKQAVSVKGYTTGSGFPILARQAGIQNFRDYADTVGAFLSSYLPGYIYYDKAVLSGKCYQDLIVKANSSEDLEIQEHNTPMLPKPVEEPPELITLDELDALYEAGAWVSFLSSPVLQKTPPARLSDKYFEMAVNCAEQLLHKDQAQDIQLNKFQRQLFTADSAVELIKGWKSSSMLNTILNQCLEGCYESGTSAFKLINRIGHTNGNNAAWRGIRTRFGACKNVLLPHIVLINAFVSSTDDIISEFCTLIKSWDESYRKKQIDTDLLLDVFQAFLKTYHKYILHGESFLIRHRTGIFSVYLDLRRPDRLPDVLNMLDTEHNGRYQMLADIIKHGETWTKEQFALLASKAVSEKLLAKCVAILWERHTDPSIFHEGLLRLLAWILKDYGRLVMDEILQLHYSSEFTKLEKKIYLLSQLERLCTLIEDAPEMYLLGTYTYYYVYPNISLAKLTPKNIAGIDYWASQSEAYYQRKLQSLGRLTQENEQQFSALLETFRYDPPHQRLLQEQYAEWFCPQLSPDILEDQAQDLLNLLHQKQAHIAYIRTFNTWVKIFPQFLTRYSLLCNYADSMMAIDQYAELVAFANGCEDISDDQRTELLIRALTENFRSYGLEARAFALFTEDFTEEDAIALLLKQNMSYDRPGVVNSLIALYAHRKEYSKAHYLALIFRKRTEFGFRLLFSHFLSVAGKFGRYYQKESNHYEAIFLALQTLDPGALLDFLRMAAQIKIPGYKDYDQNHVYAHLYNVLLSDPGKSKPWLTLLQHSIKNLKHNLWHVVICERVLRMQFGNASSMQSGPCINKLLNESKIEDLPYNVLPYVCLYIMDTGDRNTIGLLAQLFEQEEFVIRIITGNPWNEEYSKIWSQFTQYCQELYARTQDEVVYALIQRTGMPLRNNAIKKIQTSDQDKQYLFKQICDNYLKGESLSEITNIVNDSEWEYLSASDTEMLKVMRTIFADDEYFLTEYEELYPDEESVHLLKRDCMQILREYPHKKQLYEFEKSGSNLAHKFLVYSVLFPVLYDEGIYKRCCEAWRSEIQDKRTIQAYYTFLEKTFLLQLNVNSSYLMLYKRFRYLKLYINMVCLHGMEADDSFIISAMEQNQHMEQVYNTFYVPMKHNMAQFQQITGLSKTAKIRFLEGLVNGPMNIFLRHHDAELEALPTEDKAILRRMLDSMDWRCANEDLYRHYWDQIQKGDCTRAQAAAEAFSVYACDTLRAFQDGWFEKLGGINFYASLTEDQGKKLKTISSMKQDLFERNQSFLIPALCSRAFPHAILYSMRYNVLQHKTLPPRYENITKYLTQNGHTETAQAFQYLHALLGCVRGDRNAAANILKEHDLLTGIPSLWDTEAERIRQYASGASKQFIRDQSITDGSKIGDNKRTQFSFVDQLARKLGIRRNMQEIPVMIDLYEEFKATQNDPWKQMQCGIRLLLCYNRNRFREYQDAHLPTYSRLAVEVGLITMAGEINLPADDKIAVAADLYESRELIRKFKTDSELENFCDRFRELLRKQLNISTWIRHAESIRGFLINNNDDHDFSEVCKKILKPCMQYMEPKCPLDARADNLRKLLGEFRNLPLHGSDYARDVERAIGAELRRLADGTCLRVSIVNEHDTITNGCVYFQIENVGKRTASMKNDNITVLIQSGSEREHSIAITDIQDLRSGFVTGGFDRLQHPGETNTTVVSIRIVQRTSHSEQILCSTTRQLIWSECDTNLTIRNENEYEVDRAVKQERLLFGRDPDKENLSWCVPKGVTIIYGPSRIGKTSLLNWVQNDLAKKKGNVMTLLYGGEKAAYKFRDWSTKNYADGTNVIPYDNDKKMSEYLLADTIVHGLHMRTRFTAPSAVTTGNEVLDEMRRIMQKNTYLIERYFELDEYLGSKGLELWLLLDEFQQIVQHWEITSGCDFHSVCRQIGDDIRNIKLVLCGSDELLKHMVLKRSSEWKSVLQGCKTHQVEPLDSEHFEKMICEEPSLVGTNIHYSASALRALFDYTDGVALYGKEICNALLRDIQSAPDNYKGRNTIYISDIAKMTQRLLNAQADELTMQAKESISRIYKEVTKILDTNTNNVLWYIARWLDENPQADSFNERLLYDQKLNISNQALEESLTIARARGIIRAKSKLAEHQGFYVFRTLFYYFAFLGSAPRMKKLEEVLIAPLAEEDEIMTDKARLDDIVENFKLVDNRRKALQTLYANMEPDEQEEYLKGIAPRQHVGDIVGGGKFVAQNMQINSQTINNTFQNLLAGPVDAKAFTEALKGMPTISGYLGEDKRKLLKELEGNVLKAKSQDEKEEIQNEIMAIKAHAENEMVGDTLSAAVRTEGFLDVDEKRWISLLKLSDQKQYKQLQNLPAEFIAPLGFAVMLHNIFQRIEDNAPDANKDELDFCPVAIMYCKVVEGLLKKLHTPIYVHKLGHIATIKKKVFFDSLLDKDGVTITETKDLSIGSFSINLGYSTTENPLDNREDFAVTVKTKIISILSQSKDPSVRMKWCDHACTLPVVLAIRNKSAHDAAPITRANFDWLLEELFQKGGLLRIVELAEETPI